MSTQPLMQMQAASLRLGRAKRFGPFDLSLHAGERVAVLGASSAGKSTLLKLLAGELQAQAGQVLLDGRALKEWRAQDLALRRAVLPQSHAVAFGLEVELVVSLGRVARGPDPELDKTVRQALQLAQASHLVGRRFDTLSGGEQARVQLARVFAQAWHSEQGLLLVDEPLAALDPGLQFELTDGLMDFARQRGHALVAVLHDLNQALSGSYSRLWLVRDGRLLHDLAADAAALPALEALYGISLRAVHDEQGLAVVRRRRLAA